VFAFSDFRRAFALVDVLVGTVLIGICLSVIVGLGGRAVASQRLGEEIATAANLADEQLQLLLARGPDDYAKRFSLEGACEPPFESYHYKLLISGGSTNKPYDVSCTISWKGASSQSLRIDTLMASRLGGEGEPDPIRAPESAIIRTP
jgi:hypothetical protein